MGGGLSSRLRRARTRFTTALAVFRDPEQQDFEAYKAARVAERAARRAERRESQWRARFIGIASRITPYVAVENEGALYFLPTRQKSGVDRFTKRAWKETRHLQRALDVLEEVGVEVPRATFVDVGAHIGTTAIAAVSRFGFESAVALEPERANYRLMRANLAANDLEAKVETFNVAVSSRVGTADLKLRPKFGSKHRLVVEGEVVPGAVGVSLTTLDTLVENGSLDPVQTSLLWLDVEGHELEVLQGARRLVERSVPIVMEFVPRRLRQDGRLGALGGLLAEHYTDVLDLRPRDDPDIRPLDELDVIAKRYARGFTDLLVFRSPKPASPRAAGSERGGVEGERRSEAGTDVERLRAAE
jgi:FkbM family methyltransferase